MKNWKKFSRVFLFSLLTLILGAGILSPRVEMAQAAPRSAAVRDVIISEVAWGGTSSTYTTDEWIELYNQTGTAINLSGWTLAADDGDPSISLTGIIPAHGYYLLESGDDTTISNIAADQTYSGSLSNSGEVLRLKDSSAVQIDTANNDGTLAWNFGSGSPTYYSMERTTTPSILADGTAGAWFSNGGVIRNGLDAGGFAINGTPHNSKVDLSITVTADNLTPTAGVDTVTFTITVKNNDLYNSATNIVVRDLLPPGVTYQSFSGAGTYTPGAIGVWTLPTPLANGGATATINITVKVDTTTVKTYRAEILSVDQFDPDSTPGNGITTEDDYGYVKATPPGSPSLTITNSANNSNPNTGSNVVFTIMVSNPSSSLYSASMTEVSALLPSGLTYVSYSSTQGTYNGGTGLWSVGTIGVNSSATLFVTAKLTSSIPNPNNYSVTVSSDEFVNSAAVASITPGANTDADLSLSQSWSRSTSTADTASITLKVHNAGPDSATNIQVLDILPSGLDYVAYSSSDSTSTYISTSGIWAIDTIPSASDVTLTITVKVSASGASTTNFAEIWKSDQYDQDSTPGNGNRGEDDDTSYPGASVPGADVLVADLSVNETVNVANGKAVFTITLKNSGPDNASGVNIKNSLLSNATYYSYISSSSTLGTYTSGTGDWYIPVLPDGTTATLTVTTSINTATPAQNWTQVSAVNEVDPDSLPNNCPNPGSSSTCNEDDDASAPSSANLSLDIKANGLDTPLTSNVCAYVIFTITVTNGGPDDAANVTVKDLLPASLVYSAHTSGMTYDSLTGIWSVGAIPANGSKMLSITTRVKSMGTITNAAQVWSSDQLDPNSTPGNNLVTEDDYDASTLNSTSGAYVDLSVSQAWARSLWATDTAVLTITVTNTSTTDAANGIYIEDKLPAGLVYVSSSPSGVYNSSTGIWTVASSTTLAKGSSATLTINAKVDKDGTSTSNTARVKQSNQCDLNPVNDEATSEVLIADLSLTETGNASGTLFTITINNAGPDDATGVKVKTPFTNYTILSNDSGNSGGTFTYDATNKVWIWNLISPLLKSTSRTLTVITTPPPATNPYPSNWVEISDSALVDFDSVPNNCSVTAANPACNEDDDDKYPVPLADLYVTQTVDEDNPDPADFVGTQTNQTKHSNLVTFTIRVKNLGDSSATSVKIQDVLPSGLTWKSNTFNTNSSCATIDGQSYSRTSGTWAIGTLASGACVEMKITATVYLNGIITNTAWVSAVNEKDPDPYNNTATATITTHRAIILNEVAWAGTEASAGDEWIELYNPTAADIIITGWKLKINTGCNQPGGDYISLSSVSGKIARGGYYLLERGKGTVTSEAQDQIYDALPLSDTGATLWLCDDKENFIDNANVEGDQLPTQNPWPQGSTVVNLNGVIRPSMERQGTTPENDSTWITNAGIIKNGRDANNDYIYGTPKRQNSSPATPTRIPPTRTPLPPIDRPIINEFLARPGYDWNQDGRVDVFDEFIEIKNIGVTNIRMRGWMIDDEEDAGSEPFALPDITLKPGDRVVYYGLQTNILLGDGGDTVRLLNPNGKVYDKYTYSVVKVEDRSVCRLPDGNGGWYRDCIPTPGLTNSRSGIVPIMGDINYQSPVCDLPDTLPRDFLFAECRGYGANIWRVFWDFDWLFLPDPHSKQKTFFQ